MKSHLSEKAHNASWCFRTLFDALKMRMESRHPDLLLQPNWVNLTMLATVGGCVSLAMRLHFDIPEADRTNLELSMQDGLKSIFPDAEMPYRDCYNYIIESFRGIPRADRGRYFFVLVALWVFKASTNGDIEAQESIIAQIADIYQKETIGYWTDKNTVASVDNNSIFQKSAPILLTIARWILVIPSLLLSYELLLKINLWILSYLIRGALFIGSDFTNVIATHTSLFLSNFIAWCTSILLASFVAPKSRYFVIATVSIAVLLIYGITASVSLFLHKTPFGYFWTNTLSTFCAIISVLLNAKRFSQLTDKK